MGSGIQGKSSSAVKLLPWNLDSMPKCCRILNPVDSCSCLCRHVRLGWKPLSSLEEVEQAFSQTTAKDLGEVPRGGVRLGPLDHFDLSSSVLVTTYNRTPYFYEQVDPVLTPESRFPTDKLKIQVVVEEEEKEEELDKPRPQKVNLAA